MHKILVFLLCVMSAFAATTGCNNGADSPGKILMGYMSVSTGLPLFVALERDMFKQEGLFVEGIRFESVNQAMNALIAGRIDGVQGVDFTTFMAIEQNTPGQFKMFWSCADTKQKFTNGLLKRKGSSFNSIHDLKGHRLGTYTGTTQLINVKVILRRLGIDPERDLEIIQVGRQIELQAFDAGQFDALFTIEPNVTIALEKGIGEVLEENPRVKYIYDPFVAGGAVLSTRFIEERPEDVKRIVAVANEAIEYIRNNEEEAKRYLPKYIPITESIALKTGLYEFWKLGEEDQHAMQSLADIYFHEGALNVSIDTSTMLLYLPQ